jgi:hypothetical protein
MCSYNRFAWLQAQVKLTASHFRSTPYHFLSNKTLPVPAALVCLILLSHTGTFSSRTAVFTTNPVIPCAFLHFLLVTSYKVKCLPSLEGSTCNEKLLNIEVVQRRLRNLKLVFCRRRSTLYLHPNIFPKKENSSQSG